MQLLLPLNAARCAGDIYDKREIRCSPLTLNAKSLHAASEKLLFTSRYKFKLQRTGYTYPFITTGLNDNDNFLFLI